MAIQPVTNPLLAAALEYEGMGFSVIPAFGIGSNGQCSCRKADCKSPGKHAVLNWKAYQKNRATVAQIREWWTRWPEANVAIITGAVSNLIVLDIDGPDGEAAIAHYDIPATAVVTTGKGKHLYFRHPGGDCRNFAAKAGKTILPSVDFRGDGGYVIAPPSTHLSKRVYAWATIAPVAAAPDWLVDLVRNRAVVKLRPEEWEDDVIKGERNTRVARMAGSLLARKMPIDEALEVMQVWNERHCAPPLSREEVETIVQSIASRERVQYKLTDYGNAERLVARHGDDLRYCWAWNRWLVWDGKRWEVDDAVAIQRMKETIRSLYLELPDIQNAEEREAYAKFILRSESADKLMSALTLAKSEPGVVVKPEELNASPWLINVQNGTLDLKTGDLRPHLREDLLTHVLDISYDPTAQAPRWELFLSEIMDGRPQLVEFLRRAVGMSISGDVSEHVLFVLHGTGRNGKSTLINTLMTLLGEYAGTAAPNLLMSKGFDAHPTELADLFGKRFVSTIESAQGKALAESLVKQLTGGDAIKARRMREDFWQFMPTHKLWLATNYKPTIRGSDLGIWSRLKLIPFDVAFENGDKQLADKLRLEFPGIFAWAVAGCLEWQRDGLTVPSEVLAATSEYRGEQDVVANFLDDICETGKAFVATAGDLYRAYKDWCQETGERSVSKNAFGMLLTAKGFEQAKGSGGVRKWRGLRLAAHEFDSE